MEAQARFSEEILSLFYRMGIDAAQPVTYRQAKYDSQNLLNITTHTGGVNPEGQPFSHQVYYTYLAPVTRLRIKALLNLAAIGVCLALILFVPAGTLHYWQAWVFLAIFLGGSVLTTLYLMRKDPALLQRRMRGGPTGEKEVTQKIIMVFASIGFVAVLVVPAFDYRFGWSAVPLPVVILGDAMVAVGLYFTFLVFKENTFASATIEVVEDQQVISTGPYALVRHPMYASAMLYLIGIPPALGSYWGLLGLAFMLPSLIWRHFDEEKLLAKNLPGYKEYQQKVRYRLVPNLW